MIIRIRHLFRVLLHSLLFRVLLLFFFFFLILLILLVIYDAVVLPIMNLQFFKIGEIVVYGFDASLTTVIVV